MHKQDHTATDKGLDTIMEAMYAAAALEPLSEDCGTSHPFVRKKGPDKNKKFKKHHLDKEKDEEFKPKKEAAEATPCEHCGGTGKHADGSTCPECDGAGEIILGSEDAADDKQYGGPSLDDLALSDDGSEMTGTLTTTEKDEDGNYKSLTVSINMMDPVDIKYTLRPSGPEPGAGESILQLTLGMNLHPEETERKPLTHTPDPSGDYEYNPMARL